MPTDFDELKRQLLQTDEEYRQLATQHHDLDEKTTQPWLLDTTSRNQNSSKKSPSRNGSSSSRIRWKTSSGSTVPAEPVPLARN